MIVQSSHDTIIVVIIIIIPAFVLAPTAPVVIIIVPLAHAIITEDALEGIHDEIEQIEASEESDVEDGVWVHVPHIEGIVDEVESGFLVSHVKDGGVGEVRLAPCEKLSHPVNAWSALSCAEGDPHEPHFLPFIHIIVDKVRIWNDIIDEKWPNHH